MYNIKFSKRALKSLKSIAKVYQTLILNKIKSLSENPQNAQNVKALVGENNSYRLRVGDYRVIFQIENNELIILIVDIDHRKNIYKKYL